MSPRMRWPLALLLLLMLRRGGADRESRPNFLLIMVDDLGIGDIGCYGNKTIRTPHIDQLASEGVKLTQHLSAAALCTPSRAAFLTGRYALRSGLGGSGRVQVVLFLAASGGLPPNETTFAKVLQDRGYATGIVGKWHLGVNCESRADHCHHPNHHGFSFFYGLPFTNFKDCRPGEGSDVLRDVQGGLLWGSGLAGLGVLVLLVGGAGGRLELLLGLLCVLGFLLWLVAFGLLRRWNCLLMRDGEVLEQPLLLDTLNLRLLRQAEHFLERQRDGPFLLFLSLVHVHTPLFRTEGFAGKSGHGLYGDNVEEVDWMVGRMMSKVESLGLTNKTLIYFTSDHGGHVEEGQRGGWNGIYRGGKSMGGWEGGIRVPGIFRWPGRVAAGREVSEPTSLMDVFPTVVKLGGADPPRRRVLDGHDLFPLLDGSSERSQHHVMFHYCGAHLHAARWRPPNGHHVFKLHFFTPRFSPPGAIGCHHTGICQCHGEFVRRHDPPLMFELSRDPSESRPLTAETEPRYAEVLRVVERALAQHRATLEPVEEQLSWSNVVWKPWLQPCCGTFPFCACSERDTPTDPAP